LTGSGTSADPYIISTETDLYNIRNAKSAYYELANDITLTAYQTGTGWLPIGQSSPYFTGQLDGKGFKISNLFINRTSAYCGLFGVLHINAVVKNVALENCDITTTGSYAGALCGYAYDTDIDNCYSTGSITGLNYVGGLIGNGSTDNTVDNCYSTCNVSGANYIGGLIGGIIHTLTDSYSTGTVTATGVSKGGLIGYASVGSVITRSFWDTDTSGIATSNGGTGKTTLEMKDIDTFVGWDFINDWNMTDGEEYPYLRVFDPDSNREDVVEAYLSIIQRQCNLSIISRECNLNIQ
jgi:hypothetical protein